MKFSKSDAFFSVCVLLCSAYLLYLYVLDVNAEIASGRATELGTIVFRKNTATRKPSESMRWERLRNLSTIYEGDTVRTSDASEAAVNFEDGTSLDVFENSMLKINFAGPVQEFEYMGGSMSLGGTAGGADGTGRTSDTVVKVGDSRINISSDSQVAFSSVGTNLSVDVSSGEATVTNSRGDVTQIQTNQALRLDTESGVSSVVEINLVPLAPRQNTRLLDQQEGAKTAVPFSMKLNAAPDKSRNIALELSRQSDFTTIDESTTVSVIKGNSGPYGATVPLEAGLWFWRLRGDEGEESPPRRFSLSQELPVIPTLPTGKSEFSYRKILPSIRFTWRQSELVSAYILEIAGDPSFTTKLTRSRTTLSALTVQTLKAGTWYWRVVPVYSHEMVNKPIEAPVMSFTIRQMENMKALAPVMPTDGLLYQIQEAAERGYSFSWQPEAEADTYELTVSKKMDLTNPLGQFSSTRPYLQLTSEAVPFLAEAGQYYWSVRWKDKEGNVSPVSKTQMINGIDGSIAMRLSWPIDGYIVADSLISSTRFAWKTNVNTKTVFQISKDPLFVSGVYEELARTDATIGKAWATGDWYWRLRAYNVDDSVFLETPARLVRIAKPLPAAKLEYPVPQSSFIIEKDSSVTFRWQVVPGADYYKLQLFQGNGGGEGSLAVPTFESSQLSAATCKVPLGSLPDGKYRSVIQGFALDSAYSTRIIGYRSDDSFTVKKLIPIELLSPARSKIIDGLEARRKGVSFEWKAPDTPKELILNITRNGVKFSIPFKYSSGMAVWHLSRLGEGTYEWSIKASQSGFDMSSRQPQRFSVGSIPNLLSPLLINPPDKAGFGPAQLSVSRSLKFSWNAVPGANRYIVNIYRANEVKPVLSVSDLRETEYVLKDLSTLDRGSFSWEVIPQSYWTDGELERSGDGTRGDFSITLPELKKPGAKTDGVYYGN